MTNKIEYYHQTCNQPMIIMMLQSVPITSFAVVFNYIDHTWTLRCPICSQIYILSPKYSGFQKFFSQPTAGLTNRRKVTHSDPGTPLLTTNLHQESRVLSTNLHEESQQFFRDLQREFHEESHQFFRDLEAARATQQQEQSRNHRVFLVIICVIVPLVIVGSVILLRSID